MSAKTKELIAKYSQEIAALKSLQEEYDKVCEQIKSIPSSGDAYEDFANAQELVNRQASIYQGLIELRSGLSRSIEEEYWNVPFAKPRNQGIENFWKAAL